MVVSYTGSEVSITIVILFILFLLIAFALIYFVPKATFSISHLYRIFINKYAAGIEIT